MSGRVLAVASGKGGVGKTTTAVNVAAVMAEADRSVVLVDADLGMANVDHVVACDESATATLHDVLADDAALTDATAAAPAGFDVIVGGTTITDFGRADPSALPDVAATLRDRYDCVIVDTGGGLSHDTTVPLGLADETVLVSTRQTAALANTAKTRALVERVGGHVAGAVVTRVTDDAGGADAGHGDAAAATLQTDILGLIPEDSRVADSERAGTPLVSLAPESPAAQAYRELAYTLLDEPLPVSFRDGDASGDAASGLMAASAPSGAPTDDGSGAGAATGDDQTRDASILWRLTGGLLGSNGKR
ncbi:MinD/ParA family protein [Halobacterium salinarum]|uniref:MinD/ParA family ATP-binding protein n=1 Tax=Halobacterium salinarum TaxID=2242 RepID=UPI002556618D|nr:MinD/ParA family protein [Halobacterium salinarum]MDL0126253.1 MinD/ParA family protein [Halobacterium salinarum]